MRLVRYDPKNHDAILDKYTSSGFTLHPKVAIPGTVDIYLVVKNNILIGIFDKYKMFPNARVRYAELSIPDVYFIKKPGTSWERI